MSFRTCVLLPGLALGLSACAVNPPPAPDRASLPPSSAVSTSAPPDVEDEAAALTLDSAIEAALLNNPDLRAQYARFEAMLLDVPQASSLPDPMAMVSQMEAFRGPGNMRENMLTLSQTFPWFGKRELRGRVARTEAYETLEDYRMNALQVRRDVTRAWHQLRYAEENRELTLQDKELLEETIGATAALYEVGRVDRSALLRSQTEIALVESELPEIEAEIESLRRELDRLMGVRGRIDNATLSSNDKASPALPELDVLLAEAIEHRPELERFRRQEERGQLAERLAKADYYPDFTLGVGYSPMGERGGEYYSPTSDERTDRWLASVGINIPIPNARRRAAGDQARKRVEEATLRQESVENDIVEAIHATAARLRALDHQRSLFRDSIVPIAEEANEAADAAYRAGSATYVDLIDVQRTLIAARRDGLRVTRDYNLSLADLERAVGLPLDLIPSQEEQRP